METINNPIMNNLRELFVVLKEKKIQFSERRTSITYNGNSMDVEIVSFPFPLYFRIDKDGIYNKPKIWKIRG